MKTTKEVNDPKVLRVNSALKSGNAASDNCYAERNINNALSGCVLGGKCVDEKGLKWCLAASGEPNWWKDFPGMTQDAACKLSAKHLIVHDEWRGAGGLLPKMGCSLDYWTMVMRGS